MSKIFGYSKKGGKDWFKTDAYSDKEIEQIKDPEGGSDITLPTAIPSPFARIDLVKSSFRNLANCPNLQPYTKNGNTIASKHDEKLVSDCLDLAELLFNVDSLEDSVRIIPWDRKEHLDKLKKSNEKHRRLAETLDLYLTQDDVSYNFDRLDRLFLVEYKHKIIGCTSPSTLFFTSANNLSSAQIRLTNNDILFDDQYAALHERDGEFQKYLYLLFKANPILSKRLKDFNAYLNKNLEILESKKKDLYMEIMNLNKDDFNRLYSELNTGTTNSEVTVIGVGLKKRKLEDLPTYIAENSDFRISSNKYRHEKKPLVLQNEFPKDWLYANDNWKKMKVPYLDKNSLENRKLPGTSIKYPYLTVSDFLEPYLIRLIYPVNSEKFYDGSLKFAAGDNKNGYLLPLKNYFFKFFDTEDLYKSKANKPIIEINQNLHNSVKVTLKIPVTKSGEFIEFERTYYESSPNEITKPEISRNRGVVVEHQVGVTIFPFIKVGDNKIKPKYRVQLIDRDISDLLKSSDYNLSFFKNKQSETIEYTAKKTRSRKDSKAGATSQYYVLDNEFDYIQISNSITSGIIIPKWRPYSKGHESFTFAIDFGTTNTHLEYKIGNDLPKPFNISTDDVQIASLFHPSKTTEDFSGTGAIAIRELIEHEFVPMLIGEKSNFVLPQRTVISENQSLDISTETFTLADFNIPFTYEMQVSRDKIHSNLKWANKKMGNTKRVEAFFEEIIMLMRNKVLFNGGDLSKTKLIWFYPSSMTHGRKGDLENTWKKLFKEYFNPDEDPIGITESLAPFYYFKNRLIGGGASRPVVSIDIGGGTSDVVIFKEGKPLVLTSFKFAGNALFGDGFSEYGAAKTDGMITKYISYFENILGTNKNYDLIQVLSSIKEKNKTEDLNSFFFSIENNPKIKDKSLYSYNALLAKDEDLKIIFLYFYAAIMYHIAELIKVKSIGLPKDIIFSGTGSKILQIITSDFKMLSNFTKLIFEKVLEKEYDISGLKIRVEEEKPKEVTSKGGLMSELGDLQLDIKDIKTILNGFNESESPDLTYSQIDDQLLSKIGEHVREFNDFFIELNTHMDFNYYFNVSSPSYEIFKNELNTHIHDYLIEGLKFSKKLDEITDDEKILGETVFFYPMIGLINNLLKDLCTLSPVNK